MTGHLVLNTVGKLAKRTDRFATPRGSPSLVAPTQWMSSRNRKLRPLRFCCSMSSRLLRPSSWPIEPAPQDY